MSFFPIADFGVLKIPHPGSTNLGYPWRGPREGPREGSPGVQKWGQNGYKFDDFGVFLRGFGEVPGGMAVGTTLREVVGVMRTPRGGLPKTFKNGSNFDESGSDF